MDEIEHINHILRKVNDDVAFVLVNGIKLYSLEDLKDALEIITDDLYSKHVTPERNDIINWIRDVFNDYHLAAKLVGKNKKEAAEIIEERLNFLRKRLNYKEEINKNKEVKKIWIYDFIIGFILGIIFGWLLALII